MWKYSPAMEMGNLTRAFRHLITAKRWHNNLTWITIHTPNMCLKRHFCCAYKLLCNAVISFTLFCYFIRYETRNDVWTCYWFVAMLVIHIRKQCVKVSETGIWLSSLRALSVLFHSCSLRNLKFQTTQHFSVIKDNSPRNNPVLVSVTWVLPNTNENALDFPSLIHTTCKSLLIYLLTYWLTYLTNSLTHSLHGRNSFLRS